MTSIGDNIRNYRKKRNHKQTTIANYLNLTQGHYSCIENNKTAISLEQAKKIADFLELKIDDLFYSPNKFN